MLDSLPPEERARLVDEAAAAVAQKNRARIFQVISEALAGLLLAGTFDDMSEAEMEAAVDCVVSELGVSRVRRLQ